MVALVISVVALVVASLATHKIFTYEADTYISDCENLEIYDDLEMRIKDFESAINAHVVNIRELEAKVSGLRTEVEGLSTTLSNIIEFADRTRGMVEENKRNIELDN